MSYIWRYKTPDGIDDILMRSDGEFLTGLWFEDSGAERKHTGQREWCELPVFRETEKWLDGYFTGDLTAELPKFRIENPTPFREEVLTILGEIPFGETLSYGDIADRIAAKRGISKMSAQAVGGAVGWNPISIMIPCHRVVGADGSLTGYGGGLKNKKWLLEHEQKK